MKKLLPLLLALVAGTAHAQIVLPGGGSGGGSGGAISFPQTVGGTTTSGGVPYFSSATVLSSSAVIAANSLMVGGGAGVAPHSVTTAASALTTIATTVNAAGGIVSPTPAAAGDVIYWSGTAWVKFAGNASGVGFFTENASGAPSWSAGSSNVPVVAKSSAYTIVSGDNGTLFQVTGTTTITLPTPAASFNTAVMNANATGGASVTVNPPSGVTINVGGTVAATSVTLTPGQTMFYGVNASAAGYLGSTGPAGPTGATGAAGASGALFGPGNKTGVWYQNQGAGGFSTGVGATLASTSTAYCTAIWITNVGTSGGSGTLAALQFRISTAGTSTFQGALYTNDTTQTPNRPLTLMGVTTAESNTSGQAASPLSGVSVSAGGTYWACIAAADLTFKYSPVSSSPFGYSGPYETLIGSTTGFSGATFVNGVHTTSGMGACCGSGVWPSTYSGATWVEDGQGPFVGYEFTSIP